MDLFEKLKAEPPINKYKGDTSAPKTSKWTDEEKATKKEVKRRDTLPTSSSKGDSSPPRTSKAADKAVATKETPVNKYKGDSSHPKSSKEPTKKEATKNQVKRRESLPTTSTKAWLKKPKKGRSVSPSSSPSPQSTPSSTKRVKVLVERVSDAPSDGESKKLNSSSTETAPPGKKRGRPLKVPTTPTPMMPTKAQKKLFEPPVLKKVAALTQPYKIKRCVVRIKRENLKELQARGIPRGRGRPKKKANSKKESPAKSPPKTAGFYIKLPAKPLRKSKGTDSPTLSTKASRKATASPATRHDSVSPINKADKKSHKIAKKKPGGAFARGSRPNRIELVNQFGKRFFNSYVRIKRSQHPMMLIFESNARAQRLLAKPRKSKNLSVSFKEQVEIFGDSSDSDFCDDMPSTSKKPLVTPARLSKVENGKIIGDFELDSSLYVDPKQASTPLAVARKKREKKSFSPLKDDGTPSPRKEHLKLANEKLPPSGLRRMTIEEMDDEDENDECEYIVPIEIPPRRISQTSLSSAIAATGDASKTTDEPLIQPIEEPIEEPSVELIDEPNGEPTLKDAGAAVEIPLNTSEESTKETVEETTLDPAEKPPSATPTPIQQSPSGSVTSSPAKIADSGSLINSSESFVSAEGEQTAESIADITENENDADVVMEAVETELESQENQPQEKADIVAEINGNGVTPTSFLNDFPEENEQEEPTEKANYNNNSPGLEEDMDLHLFVENDLDDSLMMASPNVEREVNEMLATLPKDVDMTDLSGAAQTDAAGSVMLDNATELSI